MSSKKQNSTNDLMALALEATQSNITKRSSRKSINDSLLELLYGEGKEPMAKDAIVASISLERLKNEVGGELTPELFQQKDTQKAFKAINKTVSNGFDTAVCNGKTSASFCSNKRFDNYELVKEGNLFTIVDKK